MPASAVISHSQPVISPSKRQFLMHGLHIARAALPAAQSGRAHTLPSRDLFQARSLGTLAAMHANASTMLVLHVTQQVSVIQAPWQRVPANGGAATHRPVRA